jgi:hypothetical protein
MSVDGLARKIRELMAAGTAREGGSRVTLKIESRRGILSEPPDQPRHNNRTDQQPEHQRKKRYHRSYEYHVGRPHQNSSAALELRSSLDCQPLRANILRRPGPGRPAGRAARQRPQKHEACRKEKNPVRRGQLVSKPQVGVSTCSPSMTRFERQSSLLTPMRPQRIPLRINGLLDKPANAFGCRSAQSRPLWSKDFRRSFGMSLSHQARRRSLPPSCSGSQALEGAPGNLGGT